MATSSVSTPPRVKNIARLEPNDYFFCTDCGAIFPSHGAWDGAEELCNACYDAQFLPIQPNKAKRMTRRTRAHRRAA